MSHVTSNVGPSGVHIHNIEQCSALPSMLRTKGVNACVLARTVVCAN